MKPSKILVIATFVFATISLTNCELLNLNLKTNTPVFSIDKFEENLVDYVKDNGQTPVGWAYTISHNGVLERSFAEGKARTSADGELDFSVNKEINVASISKFYTAIGAMQLLEANDLSIDDKVATWLPDSWRKGPGINELTFAELLSHTSGLQSVNTNFDSTLTYDGLRSCIQTGVVNPKSRQYLNVNFALFRVLIPSLYYNLNPDLGINLDSDENTQFFYLLYMQENVFDPLELPLIGCVPEGVDESTLYYNINDPANNRNGAYYGDWNKWCGGGGYFMSVMEMAKVLAYFEHTETLLAKEQRDIMKANRLGMDLEDVFREEHGMYYGKNGSIGNNDDPALSQGVITQMVMFPFNGIDCVVVMNCQGMTFKDGNNLRQTIYDAYNDAWE